MKSEAAPEELTAIHTQVIAAREGRDPRVIARLFSGWAVFGAQQFVRGYALLLPDPVVPNLNSLGARERIAFLSDMSRLGDALLKVTGATRINYAIFGNQDPALHAHVIPRYLDEPEGLRTAQPWAMLSSSCWTVGSCSSPLAARCGARSPRRPSALRDRPTARRMRSC